MSSFKKKLKDNVITPYNKYSLSHEKIAEVLETNSGKNACTIVYKNVDGIMVTKHDVPCKKTARGIVNGFPKVGDFVEITEAGNIVRITGVVDKDTVAQAKQQTSDIYSGIVDYGGLLGM